jgi:hypothetical protein
MWAKNVGAIKNGQSRDNGNINKLPLTFIYVAIVSGLPLQFPLTFIYVSIVSGLPIGQYRDNGNINKRQRKLQGQSRMNNPETMATQINVRENLPILDCPYCFLSRLFMLPLSLDCPFLIAPTVFSHVYLCCHCLDCSFLIAPTIFSHLMAR